MPVAVHPNDLLIVDFRTTIYNKIKCFDLYCCSILILIAVGLFLVLTLPFMVLDSKVKNLKELEIDLLTASNFNLSSRPNQISADWNIQMNFKTMDKHGYFKFWDPKVSLYYNDKRIVLKKFRSFKLSSKHQPMHFGSEFTGLSGY